MFKTVGIPVVGLVENMNAFTCGKCGDETKIFGGGNKSRDLADQLEVSYLGGVPLEPQIMQMADEGTPIVVKHPDSLSTKSYLKLSKGLLEFLLK